MPLVESVARGRGDASSPVMMATVVCVLPASPVTRATVVSVLPGPDTRHGDTSADDANAVDVEAQVLSPHSNITTHTVFTSAFGGDAAAAGAGVRRPFELFMSSFRRRPPQVTYPARFRALAVIVLISSCAWVGNYLGLVLPSIEDHEETPCKYNDSQLTYNAKMLFVYFLWFAMARLSLFLPAIARRVALVQSRTHGFCRTYCIHLVLRDGPLYIFSVGSMLFWFHLMQSPSCEERSPVLYQTLKIYAIYSCLLSILCLLLTYWHNKLLIDAVREARETREPRGAPTGTLDKLETKSYDAEAFGDEDGKQYPAECAICLAVWEAADVIKVTKCHHAFHEECIGHWLETARTCALCRQDLTKPMEEPSDVVPAETIGAGVHRTVPL